MPIHDQGYRRYGGGRAPRGQGWIVIARAGIRGLFARKSMLGLLLLGWLPFLVRAVQIFAAANLPQASFLAPNTETFHDMVDSSYVNVIEFIIAVSVGAGLIANDRRANALQIYLSKPMTRSEYVFGKLSILMTFLFLVTWLPATVLLIVQIAFAGNFTFFRNNAFLFPAITLFSVLQVTTVAMTMLALSSLSNSSRYVGILYAAVIFFTQAIYGVLVAVTRSTALSFISVPASLTQVGNVIFRLPTTYETPWVVSLFVIIGIVVASALVLERRVRGVEVVA